MLSCCCCIVKLIILPSLSPLSLVRIRSGALRLRVAIAAVCFIGVALLTTLPKFPAHLSARIVLQTAPPTTIHNMHSTDEIDSRVPADDPSSHSKTASKLTFKTATQSRDMKPTQPERAHTWTPDCGAPFVLRSRDLVVFHLQHLVAPPLSAPMVHKQKPGSTLSNGRHHIR